MNFFRITLLTTLCAAIPLSADQAFAQADTVLAFSVTDTGIGFPASFRPHMFERFRQAVDTFDLLDVDFDFDDTAIDNEDHAVLDRFARVVQEHYRGSNVTIEGFADPAGSAAYNRRLSERRAESVREYLLDQGLSQERLRAVGYGSERQVVPGAAATTPGAELNRRVVFVIEGPVSEPLPGTPAEST